MLNILDNLHTKHFCGVGSKERQRNKIVGVLRARKMVREPKRGKRRREKGKKEMLADKCLDFENRQLDLSCPKQQAQRTEKSHESERPMQALKLQFQN